MTTTTINGPLPRTRRPLIAGVLRGKWRDGRAASATTPAAASAVDARRDARRRHGFAPAERDAVRRAAADGRDVSERTVDCVVERLLRELTW